MNLLTTRHYLKQAKNIIIRELMNSDQLNQDAHIDDVLVLRTDQLKQVAQRILDELMANAQLEDLDQLMAYPQPDEPDEVNAWSVDDE